MVVQPFTLGINLKYWLIFVAGAMEVFEERVDAGFVRVHFLFNKVLSLKKERGSADTSNGGTQFFCHVSIA